MGSYGNDSKLSKGRTQSIQDVITENEQAKVSDIFSYFQNRMTISCNYETLFDFH